MADLNKVMLIGRLTRDPTLKYLPNQTAIAEFGFAVGRKWAGADGQPREETTFVDCAIFGKPAETFNQYMTKGKQVFLEGRLKLDQWDDKQTSQKRSKLSVIVENFIFLGSKGDGEARSEPAQPQAARPSPRPGGYGSTKAGGEHLPRIPSEPVEVDDPVRY